MALSILSAPDGPRSATLIFALFNNVHMVGSPEQTLHYTAVRTPSQEMSRSCDRERHTTAYLLFRLCLLHIVSPDLDAWGQDASGEVGHIDPQEMGHLLSS